MMIFFVFLVPAILFIGPVQSRPEEEIKHLLSSIPIEVTEKIINHLTVGSNETGHSGNRAEDLIEDGDDVEDRTWVFENSSHVDTRRILYSKPVSSGKRPYMVYLQLTKESAKAHKYRGWLCGGVIVASYYVLTSAACVEDADRFYIVSGTTKFVDSFDYKKDDCVCKHRRKVVWKCIPKNYKFDFQDSIKWSSNDIAVVRVDKPFKLGVLEQGCQFPTSAICYNNVSRDLEKAGTKGFIAGWGSGSNFREGVYRRQQDKVHIPDNAKCLQEAKVCIMDNEQCAKKWAQKFRSIITEYMICTKDVMKRLSEICEKKYANCTDVERRLLAERESESNPNAEYQVDVGRHLQAPDDYTARRSYFLGGFCENDHGGPLIVKYRGKDRVIGIISACKIDPKSHSCHGPFLYTSVFKNRQFISCAINKDVEENCRRVFRTGVTHEEWDVDWTNYKEDDDEGDRLAESDEKNYEKPIFRQPEGKKDDEHKVVKKGDRKEDVKESREDSEEADVGADHVRAHKEDKSNEDPKRRTSRRHGKKKGRKTKARDEEEEDRKEVLYQSSKEDNVNEPDESQ